MRRKDRERDEMFAWSVVDKCSWAVLSVTLADGTPYCVPLSLAREGKSLYFHCAEEGKKTEALMNNPRVCVSCVGDTYCVQDEFALEYESAVLFGNAVRITDKEAKMHGLRLICERYAPDNMENFDKKADPAVDRTDVWRIDVTSVTGKAHSGRVVK